MGIVDILLGIRLVQVVKRQCLVRESRRVSDTKKKRETPRHALCEDEYFLHCWTEGRRPRRMGQKSKGGMYCAACDRPVMGVKNTHRFRNILSVGTSIATAGVSLLGTKVEGYACPTCRGAVHRRL